jgi:hypothetical protein
LAEVEAPVSAARIELKLRELAQLFHSLDPSPFRERSLDSEAEAFIVSWAHDVSPRAQVELVVYLSERPRDRELAAQAEPAVQSHFAYLAERKRREFRELMARGRASLSIGLAFLGICILAGQALPGEETSTFVRILREGLLIGGWVAMWRPIEIFLYDWWGVRRQQRDYERLARMPVRIEVSA